MNNVTQGTKAIQGMIDGIKLVTNAIRPTYGHNGINVVVEADRYPFHKVANDAQTIIQAIETENPVQNRGLGFLKELSDKQNATSGDGRKTTCIIAETILEEGFKSELKGMNLKRELDALIPVIEQKIDEHKRVIDIDEVHKVATIAGESESIGNLIGSIYKTIGKDGVITVEGSGTYDDGIKYIDGVRFNDCGFLSPLMAHDKDSDKHGDTGSKKNENGMETMGDKVLTKAVYENPLILVTYQKMEKQEHFDTILGLMDKHGKKDLIIFTHDMDSRVAQVLLDTHKQEMFNICIIKAPSVFRMEVFEDFAKVTGATVISDITGLDLADLPIDLSFCGTCYKIIVDKNETTIIGTQDVSEHIAELKAQNTELANMRIKWLSTKTAVLKLGANNESELSYRRLKCEDAVNASRLALQDGVVQGGGITLYKVAHELPDTVAGDILRTALIAPVCQIMTNAGEAKKPLMMFSGADKLKLKDINTTGEIIMLPEGVEMKTLPDYMFDIPDTFGDNVLDASLVTKNAIRNAISLASTVLTTGVVITLPPKEKELPNKPFTI